MHSRDSSQLDELFQRLKERDPDWLSKILYERWIELSHQKQKPDQLLSMSSQCAVWPFDFTLPMLPQSLQVSEYVHFIRSFNWADTAFGPMSSWTLDMRRMVNMCLCDKRAAGKMATHPRIIANHIVIWSGPDHVGFYNEAYSHVAGDKHPRFLGRPFAEMWSDTVEYEAFIEVLKTGQHSGQATKADDTPYLLARNGFREEMWCSWSVVPIPDSAGGVFGLYNTVSDATQQRLSSRRLSTLISLGQATAQAPSVAIFWERLLEACEKNQCDIPFAVLYSKAAASGAVAPRPPHESLKHKRWKSEGVVGIPAQHELPTELTSHTLDEVFYPGFGDALSASQPFLLSVEAGTFPQLIQGIVKSRTYGDACEMAVTIPISPTNREDTLGFLVLGLNPNLDYANDYAEFIGLFARQCSTSLASTVLVEDEIEQSRIAAQAATQDKLRMSVELAEFQQRATDVEARFKMMADLAPVAMFHLDEKGRVLYANQNWYDLTQHVPDYHAPKSWMGNVHPADESTVEQEWSKLVGGESVNFEMRWKKPFVAEGEEHVHGERVEGPTWTIASAYADKASDGSVKAILGCLTDISRQKWMEDRQSRRMEEILALKIQQENWMDMTSHECRNPLSAIMLCAESIVTVLKDQAAQESDPVTVSSSTIESSLESAEIIMACAQHQKRIIDDVLTLSKLDSGLLTICAVEVQPAETISQALKMFDGEIHKNDIDLRFEIDSSYHNLSIDWVRLDPSRLLQVLINLLTNAIKFTQAESVRQIKVTLNATRARPKSSLHGVEYIQNEWPDEHDANTIFIGLEVIDTGRGMTADEMKRLFAKFQQASPKTHVEYGGSGLGLFISRQLSRMQGGAIGVYSSGSGATFAFYLQAPRCAAPEVAIVRKDSAANAQERTVVNEGRRPSLNEAAIELVDPSECSKQHILIVEDNIVNQKVMRNQLQRLQYFVNVANHGLEALDHIRSTRFCREDGQRLDVMLLDVEMPICNGLECARRIRQMEADGTIVGHVPIIGVTANARAEQQAAAMEWMDAVVTKPFRLFELSAALEKMKQRFVVA